MWGQSTAGVLAGLPLAFLLAGIVAALVPMGFHAKLALTVALSLPLWCVTISAAFAATTGLRAWAGMLAANLVCFALLAGLRALGLFAVPPEFLT